jgi:2',3'-cyclic-nucleotide 2'-phosphodiesterase / 3'-nucleotidase / 5'-nucleotidase
MLTGLLRTVSVSTLLALGTPASSAWAKAPAIVLQPLGSYREPDPALAGACRRNIAEIGAYDAVTRRLFVTNYLDNSVDILDIGRPEAPTRIARIAMSDPSGVNDANLTPTSVAVRFPLVAVAAEAIDPPTAPGKLLIFAIDGHLLRSFDLSLRQPGGSAQPGAHPGSGPDAITFTPDGGHVLVAVEGEPDQSPPSAGKIDPEGGVAVLDLGDGLARASLRLADFAGFDAGELVNEGVRIGADLTDPETNPLKKRLNSAAKDLEPEFIAVSPNSHRAYVTLQENNAVAVVDVDQAKVLDVLPLGLKNHGVAGAGLDPSRKDGAIQIAAQPVYGAFQPDGVAAFRSAGRVYLVTANEGDARNGDFDIAALGDLVSGKDAAGSAFAPIPLDPSFPADLADPNRLGELEISDLPRDLDPDGLDDGNAHRLVSLGGRSFSVWDSSGHPVFDSGDAFERITAAATPSLFNTQDDDNVFDRRSPKRGPEPEGIAVGKVQGSTYAFIGLERHSGIMVYDLTRPDASSFEGYFSTRNFSVVPNKVGDTELSNTQVNCAAGDLGPEGILFIPALLSPNFRPLLVVNYETSGSTRVWQIDRHDR